MDEMKGKVALITGASSGIGGASSLKFAAEGAKVALVARSKAKHLNRFFHIQPGMVPEIRNCRDCAESLIFILKPSPYCFNAAWVKPEHFI